MATKTISATQVKNNFGQVLDDATRNHTRYIVERHGIPQVIVLSFDDFSHLLANEYERKKMDAVLKEVSPTYQLGQEVPASIETK
jgi:prevent-host-death family protein